MVYLTLDFFYNTQRSAHFSYPKSKIAQLSTSPRLDSATVTMQKQQTEADQPPAGFPPSNPTTTRPSSSRYGTPLTLNVATMFVFYVLSVTLCLSSISTCVCVIFDPVGTLRTIATYLFYALGMSILLTVSFVALIGVYLDDQAVQEPRRNGNIGDEKPKQYHEQAAAERNVDATPVKEKHSALPVVEEAMLFLEANCEVSAQHSLLAHRAEGERNGRAFRPPRPDARAMTIQRPIENDASATGPPARDDGAPLSAPAANTSEQTAWQDESMAPPIQIVLTCEGISGFYEGKPASPEMSDADERKEKMPEAKAAIHTETNEDDKATNQTITARESRKIENWVTQTTLAENCAAKGTGSMLNGDNADYKHSSEEMMQMKMGERGEGVALSGTRSMIQDSDFQRALRVYMGRGKWCRMGSGNSFPSLASSEESDFQGGVRKTFMLEKGGKKRKARSL